MLVNLVWFIIIKAVFTDHDIVEGLHFMRKNAEERMRARYAFIYGSYKTATITPKNKFTSHIRLKILQSVFRGSHPVLRIAEV